MIITAQDGSLLHDDRDTRSLRISTGIVNVVEFNQTTGEIVLQFPSRHDYAAFHRNIATQLAQLDYHAVAAKSLSHATLDIATRKMKKAALTSTADVIRQAGDATDYRIANYQAHADELDKTIKQNEAQYQQAIIQLKAALSGEINLSAAFEHFNQAVELNPSQFEPYKIIFLVLPYFAEDYQAEISQIVKDAYKISPVKTFNIFRQILALHIAFATNKRQPLADAAQAGHQQRLDKFIELFVELYPNDCFTAWLLREIAQAPGSDSNELDFSEFSAQLSLGLDHVLRRSFSLARDAFSAASLYHISDPRPYAYNALLDLRQGDWLSALKLITQYLAIVLPWDEPIVSYLAQTYDFLLPATTAGTAKPPQPTMNVVKLLIELQRKPKVEQLLLKKLQMALQDYLMSPEYDLIWLELVVDVVAHRLGTSALKSLEMHMLVPYATYQVLETYHYDLSLYADRISKTEEGSFQFSVVLTIHLAAQAMPSVVINADNLQLPRDKNLAVFAAMLDRSYNKFCLLFARYGTSTAQLLECLAKVDRELYEPLAQVMLARVDASDDSKHKQDLITWVVAHEALWPANLQQKLSNVIGHWLLYMPWLCRGGENEFSSIAKQWLAQLEVDEFYLRSALQAWNYFSVNDLNNARVVTDQFFVAWKAADVNLPAKTMLVVLRSFCLLRVVLAEPLLASRFPKVYGDLYHEQMLDMALLILARSAMPTPYILPAFACEAELLTLVWFYIGHRRQETDADYLSRLQKVTRVRELGDLRQARHVTDPFLTGQATEDPVWIMQSMENTRSLHWIDAMFDRETQRQKARQENNQRIAAESCQYSDDQKFTTWVTQKTKLIDEFITDPAAVKTSLTQNKGLKTLPQGTKDRFFAECTEKAKHEQAVRELEQKRGSVAKQESERLWQLVKLAAKIVTEVRSTTRQTGDYDLVVCQQAEAFFIMQLLYEWNRAQVADDQRDKLTAAFHGPETHIWGHGPRIPHFNAGVYTEDKSTLVNVHIYYR